MDIVVRNGITVKRDVHWIWILIQKVLTHWDRVTHICVSKLTSIGSDNGLSPERCQAIIWTNAGILLIRPLGTNFSEISIEIYTFSFKKTHLKMSSGKWRSLHYETNKSYDTNKSKWVSVSVSFYVWWLFCCNKKSLTLTLTFHLGLNVLINKMVPGPE